MKITENTSTENTPASPTEYSFFNKNCNLMAFNVTKNKLLHNIFQELWSDLNFSDKTFWKVNYLRMDYQNF